MDCATDTKPHRTSPLRLHFRLSKCPLSRHDQITALSALWTALYANTHAHLCHDLRLIASQASRTTTGPRSGSIQRFTEMATQLYGCQSTAPVFNSSKLLELSRSDQRSIHMGDSVSKLRERAGVSLLALQFQQLGKPRIVYE